MSQNKKPPTKTFFQGDTGAKDAQPKANDGKPSVSEPLKISNMSYSEMLGFYNQQLGRVEMTWFRIMYLHAAIVGVLVFFGEADEFLLLQRFVVFGFFTANLLIFHVALSESYDGLRAALKDIECFPASGGHVDQWFHNHRNLYRTNVRTAVMLTTWGIVGFLLFQSLIFD